MNVNEFYFFIDNSINKVHLENKASFIQSVWKVYVYLLERGVTKYLGNEETIIEKIKVKIFLI